MGHGEPPKNDWFEGIDFCNSHPELADMTQPLVSTTALLVGALFSCCELDFPSRTVNPSRDICGGWSSTRGEATGEDETGRGRSQREGDWLDWNHPTWAAIACGPTPPWYWKVPVFRVSFLNAWHSAAMVSRHFSMFIDTFCRRYTWLRLPDVGKDLGLILPYHWPVAVHVWL